MSGCWIKIRGFTLVETLSALVIITFCFGAYITVVVNVFSTPGSLDRCEEVMQTESDYLEERAKMLSDNAGYEEAYIVVHGRPVKRIRLYTRYLTWSLWEGEQEN